MKYSIVRVDLGHIGIAAGENGLKRLTLPQPTAEDAARVLRDEGVVDGERDDEAIRPFAGPLERYYQGEEVDLSGLKLDIEEGTPFRKSVMEIVRSIPRGQVRSYGQVAAAAGSPGAARAVGAVMASNPVCIVVPCHRVIGSDGSLRGFGGGIEMKRAMLALEGVDFGGEAPARKGHPCRRQAKCQVDFGDEAPAPKGVQSRHRA